MILPLVSIAIPCYNHENYIQECINSIISQDYSNIELIIIDDGSSDNSVKKIEEMRSACEKRFVRFEFRSRANVGLSATLNEAVMWCRGDYYCTLASDDQIYPTKITIQVEYLQENPNCAAVFGGINIIDVQGKIIKKLPGEARTYNFDEIFLHKHDLPAATQMIRLNLLKEAGGYRADIVLEDLYMWLMLSQAGKTIDRLDLVLAAYRRHADNFSKKINLMSAGRIKIANLYKQHPLYRKAVANALLVDAASLQIHDKSGSFKYIKQALKSEMKIIFTVQFFKYLIKALLPKKYLLQNFGN